MFVIFGWGFTTTHVFGAVLPLLCPNCHNEQFWVLKRIRRWFTLFFIPIFPYESTHALMCPICGVGRELSGVELKRAKLFAETNAAYPGLCAKRSTRPGLGPSARHLTAR